MFLFWRLGSPVAVGTRCIALGCTVLYGRALPAITCSLSVQTMFRTMLVLPTATTARGWRSSPPWTWIAPQLPSLGTARRGARGKATVLQNGPISHWTLGPHTGVAMEQWGSLRITPVYLTRRCTLRRVPQCPVIVLQTQDQMSTTDSNKTLW